MTENKTLELVAGEDYPPLLPDGEYIAQCVRTDWGQYRGSPKIYLRLRILEGEYRNEEVFMAFNVPSDGRFYPGSKYYKAWTLARGNRPPSRNAKMSPSVFKNKVFRIRTRVVEKSDDPNHIKYSVADEIIEVDPDFDAAGSGAEDHSPWDDSHHTDDW